MVLGPVDAALNAIQKITGKVSELKITDYGLSIYFWWCNCPL